MDIASMVLGIVSLIFNFLCIFISIIAAPIGLTLGIVDLVLKRNKEDQSKGMAIAGVIMCTVSIILIIAIFMFIASGSNFQNEFYREFYNAIEGY